MKNATGTAITLMTYSDYNMYFYHQSILMAVGVMIGSIVGCFFWGWLFDRIG